MRCITNIKRLSVFLLFAGSLAFGQAWSGILDATRATDWTKAGVQGGIPNYATICQTVTPSADVTGATDAANINNALSTCAALASAGSPKVVLLGSGIFYSNAVISPPFGSKYLVLRGAGASLSIIQFVRSSGLGYCGFGSGTDICFDGTSSSGETGTTSWLGTNNAVGTYTQGASVIDLTSTASLSAGMMLVLTQINDEMGLCPQTGGVGNCSGKVGLTSNSDPTCTTDLSACLVTAVTSAPYPAIINGASAYTGSNANFSYTSCGGYQSGPVPVTASSVTTTGTNTTFTYKPNFVLGAIDTNTAKCGAGAVTVSVDNGGLYTCGVQGGCILAGHQGGTFCPDSTSGSPCPTSLGEYATRSQAETHLIMAVCTGLGTGTGPSVASCLANNEVVIDGKLIAPNYRTSQVPVVWWQGVGVGGVTDHVGVENLTVDDGNDPSSPFANIAFKNASNFWVKGVRSLYAYEAHILFNVATRGSVVDSYLFGNQHHGPQSYGLFFYNSTSYNLVQNTIFQDIGDNTSVNQSYGNVMAYNYFINFRQPISAGMNSMLNWNHGYSGANLAEGNNSNSCGADVIHGTSWAETYFRNRCRGQDTPARHLALNGLIAASDESFQRAENWVGNVLGTASVQTFYGITVYPPTPSLAIFGVNAAGGIQGGVVGKQGLFDPVAGRTLLRWANYDSVTAGIRSCGNSSSTGWGTTCKGVTSATYVSGGSATGSAGNTCLITMSGGGGSGATAWLQLTGTNSIAGATLTVSSPGMNYTSTPASGTLSTLYAPGGGCSGTVTITSIIGSISEVPTAGVAYISSNPVPTVGDTVSGQGALPNSFYLDGQPSWWSTPWGVPKWPPIGPDVNGGNNSEDISGHSDKITAQLAYENLPIDATYQGVNTINGASWTSAAVGGAALTGSFSVVADDMFTLSGITPSGYNGTYQVNTINGPGIPNQPTLTATSTASTLPIGTYYAQVTYVNVSGESSAAGSNPITTTSPNPTAHVASPVASGTTPQQATGYNVYFLLNGLYRKQNSSPVAIGTAYEQTSALASGAVLPTANTAVSTSLTFMQASNPGAYVSGGTMSSPSIRAFDTATSYGPLSFVGCDTNCVSGSFVIGAGTNFGPPLYLGSSTSTANAGTIAPIFTSHSPVGTVNTGQFGDLKRVDWVTGDKFDGGNCVVGQPIRILATNFTIATCDSAIMLHLIQIEGTFTSLSYVLPARCIGNCQNSVAYDTTINPSPGNPYTRLTDGGVSCGAAGQTMFATVSGGDNDVMWSINDDYLGVVTSGAAVCILKVSTTGANGALQVINTGMPAVKISGQLSFSKVVDTRYFYMDKTSGHAKIVQGDLAAGAVSTVETTLKDVAAAGVCPGLPQPFTVTSGSIINVSSTDNVFGFGLSNAGAQNTAIWAIAWSPTLGCTVTNFQNGNYWAWCTVSCGPSTPVSGVLSNTGCWGGKIHDVLMSSDGNFLWISAANGTLTNGACVGISNPGPSVWQIATGGDQWCDGRAPPTGKSCVDHTSVGFSHAVSNAYTGAVIRSVATVGTITQFTPAYSPLLEDWHSAWPLNPPLYNDLLPEIVATDLVGTGNGGVYAPTYLHNEIYTLFPNGTYPPGTAFRRFGHTFSCNATGSASKCTSGGDFYFEAQQAIMSCSPHGLYCALTSSMLGNLGLDSLGNRRSDVFAIRLD